jgi:hypothetical protein
MNDTTPARTIPSSGARPPRMQRACGEIALGATTQSQIIPSEIQPKTRVRHGSFRSKGSSLESNEAIQRLAVVGIVHAIHVALIGCQLRVNRRTGQSKSSLDQRLG